MSKATVPSKTSKVPATASHIPAQQVMSQEESMKLKVEEDDGSSSSGSDPNQEEETEDTPSNQSGAYPNTTTIIKYGSVGGLFGDTSIPSSLPPMPKLMGHSAYHYNDWKLKATNYFRTNGLAEIATMEPLASLNYAVAMDGNARPKAQIKSLWIRLNSKVYGVIRSAVETIIGTSFFEEVESDPTALNPLQVFTEDERKLDTDFKSGCAYYLWDNIRKKLEDFTPHDLSRLVEKYMNLKYNPRSSPIECRNQFDESVRELKLAGITLPDKLHLAIWYKAIPPELDSLRQALGAKSNLQWKDIYESISNQYSSKKSTRNSERSEEKAHAAQEAELKKKNDLRNKRDSEKNKPKAENKFKKRCSFCNGRYHDISECHFYREKQEVASTRASGNKKNKKISDSETDDEHAAVFIEDEVAATFQAQSAAELAAFGKDSNGVSDPIHFLFDSGATTHVTPVKHILEDINNFPIMTMSTAISGQRSIINKRGKVRLNDKWTLREVAYVPQATSSLISEGRLCDA
jgi:hypothetical protein